MTCRRAHPGPRTGLDIEADTGAAWLSVPLARFPCAESYDRGTFRIDREAGMLYLPYPFDAKTFEQDHAEAAFARDSQWGYSTERLSPVRKLPLLSEAGGSSAS